MCVYIYIYIYILIGSQTVSLRCRKTANFRTKTLDFRVFDSGRILI